MKKDSDNINLEFCGFLDDNEPQLSFFLDIS